MKKIISFVLAAVLLVSAIPTALATNDYSAGTKVEYVATGSESYTITVPAQLAPGGNGTVTLSCTWADNRVVTITADPTVTLTNSIKSDDQKVLDINFAGISEKGSNTGSQTFTEDVSVANIENALFGTWSGKFNYNVGIADAVKTPLKFGEKYILTTNNEMTGTGLGEWYIFYADGSAESSEAGGIPEGSFTYTETEILSTVLPEEDAMLISADGTVVTMMVNGQVLYIMTLESAIPTPTLITFTIDGQEFQAEAGMTWAQFVESEYNTNGYVTLKTIGTQGEQYAASYKGILSDDEDAVHKDELIVSNGIYMGPLEEEV